MLTADFLAALPDELVSMYSEVETEILQSIITRVQKTQALSPASVYQLEKLQDLGKLNGEVTRALAKALNISRSEVKKLLQRSGIEAISIDDAVYQAAGLNPVSVVESVALKNVMIAGIQKTNGLMQNFTGTTATTVRRAYSNLLDRAYLEVTSGAYSYDEAIRRSVKKLVKDGITSVAYPSGGMESIESSVRKCISTGVNQTVALLQLTRANELGSDLVEVTSHAGARPSHALWQGGSYSLSGKHPKYKPFYSTTGYGTVEGLCGAHCYHSFYPYIEGISSSSFVKDPAKKYLGKSNEQVYEEQQQQRLYERRVRESKRECAGYDTALSNAKSEDDAAYFKREFDKAAMLLKQRERHLADYVNSINGTADSSRVMVGGFTRSVSSKAVWAEKRVTGFNIPKSLGAKSKDYEIVDKKSGIIYNLAEGSRVVNPKTFAGYGTTHPLGQETVDGLVKEFGGSSNKWAHRKGIGVVKDGSDDRKAEIHWFEEETVGKVKFKVKKWLDE